MSKFINTLDVPMDIKFLNGVVNVLIGVFILLIALNGFEYFIKNRMKSLNIISIKGNMPHGDISSIRNIVTTNISGNFYSLNLLKTRQVFESIPWVNQAIVKRVYPNQIEVKLSEYKAKAIWGAREDMKLVDEVGVIFEANTEDDEYDQMPQLIGPEGQGKLMLNMYKDISTAFSPKKNKLKILELNARGSWVAVLDSGARIELGRGPTIDVVNRVNKFSMSADQILTKLNKNSMDIQYVDLRHSEGYALRMQGVSTVEFSAESTNVHH